MLSESVTRVPEVMSGKVVDLRVVICWRRCTTADISAALFSLMSGRGNDEATTLFPMSMTVEHPDDRDSVVEPSVKAMNWVWEG